MSPDLQWVLSIGSKHLVGANECEQKWNSVTVSKSSAFKTLLLLTTRPAACCLSLSLSPVYITPTCAMFYWSERCVYICMCVSVCVFLPTCAHSFCMLFLVRVRSRLFQGVCVILYVSVCAFSSYLCMSVCWNVFQWLWRVCLYIFLRVHLVRTLTVKDRS